MRTSQSAIKKRNHQDYLRKNKKTEILLIKIETRDLKKSMQRCTSHIERFIPFHSSEFSFF